jgi:hypothetical protein
MDRTLRGAAVAGVAGLCVFLNSLHGQLVFDDVHAVERNADVLGTTSVSQLFRNDFWGEQMASNSSHKSYRPLTIVSDALTRLARHQHSVARLQNAESVHPVTHTRDQSVDETVKALRISLRARSRPASLCSIRPSLHPAMRMFCVSLPPSLSPCLALSRALSLTPFPTPSLS